MGLHEREWHAKKGAAINRAREIEANSVNLPAYLAGRGYRVKQESSCNDYGASDTPVGSFGLKFYNGVWLYFQGSSIGNSVMLVELIDGCDKKSAVNCIIGQFSSNQTLTNNSKSIAHAKAIKNKIELILQTPQPHTIAAGQAYLTSRGIDLTTFESLLELGVTQYAWNGIAFVGKKHNGKAGMIETRLFKQLRPLDKPEKFTNHLVSGTRKYCVVIPGSANSQDIEMVEGNFDGMALYEMNKRNLPAENQPTIIITGGKDNTEMLKNTQIIAILKGAKSIKCWGDNEQVEAFDSKDPRLYQVRLLDKQSITDTAHQKRMDKISAINPTKSIVYIKPPAEIGDLAEWNVKIKLEMPKVRKFKF